MTDTTSTSTPPKKMWTRCSGCKDRIFNDPHDINIHAQHCPQDLLLALQKLRLAVVGDKDIPGTVEKSLVARLAALDEVVGHLDEHIAEPALDPDGVDLDAYADVVGVDRAPDDDLDAIAGYVDDSDVDPDDDEAAEPDLASVPPLGGTLYTPGTGPVMS